MWKTAFMGTTCTGLLSVGEQLSCMREIWNEKDLYVEAVRRKSTTVGHSPQEISAACSIFLHREGSIQCVVIGARCYSHDLPQGGLEVPCVLKFSMGSPRTCRKSEGF